MDVDNENIEPVTDLGLALSYSNQCIQRRLNSHSGAGANAGSRIHMTYVGTEPLSELVWSKHKGPSNVTLSPPQSNRPATDKPIDEENLITPETSFCVKTEVACKDMTTSPTSDAGVMPVCGPSHDHETGIGNSNVEEVKAAVEVSVPYDQATCSPVNFQGGEIPEIPETREKYFATLPGCVDREGADILLTEPDQIIPFLEQEEPLLGDPVGGDRRTDVGNQKMEMDPLLASEVHPVNEYNASGAQVVNQRSQGRKPLDKMEATAENDLQNLKSEHAYDTASQILGSESAPGVKEGFEQGEEMLPGNKFVLGKQSPTNTKVHIHRRKGKEKASSDGDLNGRMSKDDDDSYESVESCNSARLFSSSQKRWNFEEQFIVGSKRFRKKIQETAPCTSYFRPDSSFMNWISSMVKGFSNSLQDEAPSLALTLAHPHHGHGSPDNKLITYSKNKKGELKNIGFQSMFQSLYCPKADAQDTRMLNDDHQMGDISTKLEPATTPKAYHGENINLGRGFLLSVEKFNKSTFRNELRSARPYSSSAKSTGSRERGNSSSAERKNSSSLQFSKNKDGVNSNSSLGKRKKSIMNVEYSPQSEGKTTDKSGRRSDLLESLWITRFAPKMYGPSLISDHHNESAAGVLGCSNNHENEGAQERSENLVTVIGNDLQNRAADSQGSLSLSRNKGQNDQGSMPKLISILPSPIFRGSEAMASVFARRLDALKHISPSVVTGNAADEIMTCFFCGIKGHHIRECSEIRDAELPELLTKFKSFNGAEYSPFCIRCLQCSHWAIACPNEPSEGQPELECNVSCLGLYCSPSERKLNSRNDGNKKIRTGKESQFPSSVAHTCFHEDDSRMETDLNLSWKGNEMMASKKMRYHSNSVKKSISSSSGKENHILPLSQFVNTPTSDVPKRIFDSVKRLRLSRTDVLKWMKSHTSFSQLEGFFLRLRLGNWEGLGGTRYCVSCITGSQRESCPENAKNSIAVVVGGIRCVVEGQYVSNHDFLEDELSAWWSVTSKGNGKIPSEEDLSEKVKMKELLGL